MPDIMEIVFKEFDIIIKEQDKIAQYTAVLEDRRLRFLDFIQTTKELPVSKEEREDLEKNVKTLEIKVTRNVKMELIIDKTEEKTDRKCRYHDRGFCKSGKVCSYYHPKEICGNVRREGSCNRSNCLKRHPKDCKYWKGDIRGCLRGEKCMYLHTNSTKGISIKDSVHKTDSKEREKIDVDKSTKSDVEILDDAKDKGNEIRKSLNEKICSEKSEIQTVLAIKDKEITKLNKEKDDIVNQMERLKRCVSNMLKEIEMLKSKKS